MSLSVVILRLAARTVGVASDEVPGHERRKVIRAVQKLVIRGKLHKYAISWRNVRYFADPALRDAYARAALALAAEREAGERAARAAQTRSGLRAPWLSTPPERVVEVVTAATVHTRCPAFTPRFEAIVLPGLYSGNQRGRVAA